MAKGKTSFIRALHKESVEAGKEDMTPGVDICCWAVDEQAEVLEVLWDFGGQVVTHAAHQFFLRSRCVCVGISWA